MVNGEEVALRIITVILSRQLPAKRHFFPVDPTPDMSFRGFIQNIFCTPAVMTTYTV